MSYRQYFDKIRRHHARHLGYPYNLRFDARPISEALGLLINNLGDPYVASNYASDSRAYEQEVINYFLKLWQFVDGWGYVTASGTEGNLAGVLYGKCRFPDAHLVYSEATHYSIPKAAVAYGLPSVRVPAQASGEIDYCALKKVISERNPSALILVANISSTFTGAYDSPDLMIQAASECGFSRDRLYLHGDGALGGMILPFLDEVDLQLCISGEHYDSVSASGHKMPGSPVPCGVVVTRRQHMERFARRIEYLDSIDSTLNGSRSGLAAIVLFEALVARPLAYWRETVRDCISNAAHLTQQLRARGIEASCNRYSNTVVFPKPALAVVKEWQLACQGERAHAVVMPNNDVAMLDAFCAHYCADELAWEGR